MQLSAVPLNYANVNQFAKLSQWSIWAGTPNTLSFQLIDLAQGGLRYMTCAGAQPVVLTVTFPTNAAVLNTFNNNTNGGFVPFGSTLAFPELDPSQVFTITATQPSACDTSIWQVNLGPAQIPNSGCVFFTLTQGSSVSRFFVMNMLVVNQLDCGGC
jgi:hypothetical protein